MPSSKKFNSPEMDSAIQAFKDWRSSRGKIRRIPDHLWQIASNLFVQYRYPISTICRKLGLNWGDLKEKITRLSSNHPVPHQKSPSFLELKLDSQELLPNSHLSSGETLHNEVIGIISQWPQTNKEKLETSGELRAKSEFSNSLKYSVS